MTRMAGYLREKCEANARLIAAAPQMLEALKAVVLFHSGSPWNEAKALEWQRLTGILDGATTKALCGFVRSAIAAATGEGK